jgi:hypothetical protein
VLAVRRMAATAGVLVIVLTGCGGSSSEPASNSVPQTEAEAETYALDVAEQMTGERPSSPASRCADVTKVSSDGLHYVASPEAAHDAGCIYVAAWSGCLEAQSGKPASSPTKLAEELPERALQKVYRQARKDCG